MNLAEKSNADAMEALRHAMQLEGKRPGCIHVVIGRREGLTPVTTPSTPGLTPRELRISMADPADSTHTRIPSTSSDGLPPKGRDLGAGGDNKSNIAQPKAAIRNAQNETNKLRNPALDRINIGSRSTDREESGGRIHNLSYMKATHDSMMDSFADTPASPAKSENLNVPNSAKKPLNSFGSATMLSTSQKTGLSTVVIDGATYQVKMVHILQHRGVAGGLASPTSPRVSRGLVGLGTLRLGVSSLLCFVNVVSRL